MKYLEKKKGRLIMEILLAVVVSLFIIKDAPFGNIQDWIEKSNKKQRVEKRKDPDFDVNVEPKLAENYDLYGRIESQGKFGCMELEKKCAEPIWGDNKTGKFTYYGHWCCECEWGPTIK